MKEFKPSQLKSLKTGQGKLLVIGGSKLFHGAPLLALKAASRLVELVFFTSPEPSVGRVAEELKSKLASFIWVPWEEREVYLGKAEAILIGPGLMRGEQATQITGEILSKFPQKQWVIDAVSLQVMRAKQIPCGAILTPNKEEYRHLFGQIPVVQAAKKHNCIVLAKRPRAVICSPRKCCTVDVGDKGLTKGGVGDVLAGLTAGLAVQNPPSLAAAAASFITARAGEALFAQVGPNYNADDLAQKIPTIL